jgi:threonine synthase
MHVLDTLRATGDLGDWTVVATAHPAKFESVVEPLVGHPVAMPPALAAMLARPAQAEPMAAENEALSAWLRAARP